MRGIGYRAAATAAAGLLAGMIAWTSQAAPAPASTPAPAEKAAPATAQPAKESRMEMLCAGPIHLKFQDGELRYLYVGQKEIVRRIYFAVRDATWQTPLPVFSKVEVERKDDSFKITLAAACKSDTVDYAWTGEIVGTADGQITFSVKGAPQKTFKSNRIGLCVLYGADSLVGQAFEAAGADGKTTAGKFPELVSMDLVAKDYKSLTYATADGVGVECGLSPILFTMEDQRNYGDSSFKAYNTVLAGPEAKAGEEATITATLKVTGAKVAAPAAAGPVRIKIGKDLPGLKLPKLVPASASTPAGDFLSLEGKRDPIKDQAEIAFGYRPSLHLPDDDTFMENRTGLLWQLKTLRALAPKAKLRVDPLRLVDGAADPRSNGPFAMAWAVGAMKNLALGGASEMCFKIELGVLSELALGAGDPLLETQVETAGRSPVEVLALRSDHSGRNKINVVVANSTDQPQKVTVEGLPAGQRVKIDRTDRKPSVDVPAGKDVAFDLGPYETVFVTSVPPQPVP
jgi:hypothetical protein